GRDILVAPVVEKAAQSRHLYLPAGDWSDWWTGEKLAGARWIDRRVDLATMPLYIRAGAIIPLDPVRQYTSQQVSEPTTIKIYPGADSTFTLYEDDGHTLAYQSNRNAVWIQFKWDDAKRSLTIEPDQRTKRSAGAHVFNVEVAGGTSRERLEFRGERIEQQI